MDEIRGIILADGETVVREYEATYMENPRKEGYLIATNRRLIFCGEAKGMAGSSMIVKDVKIEHVTGIHAFISGGKNLRQIIGIIFLAILFIILGQVVSDLYLPELTTLFYTGLIFPGFMAYKLINNPLKTSMLSMVVMADNQTPSSVSVTAAASGNFISSLLSRPGFDGSHAALSVAAGPGRDTVEMIKELGALVLDIQAQGEYAVKRWGSKSESVESKPFSIKASQVSRSAQPACNNCGTSYSGNEKFCGGCGSSLQPQKETIPALEPEELKLEDEKFFE